jgi:predicted acylesterase/phospholipase RssA
VVQFLSRHIGGVSIEELPVKYAAVAMDVEDLVEIVIDRGDLVQAIRSSISIPVAFMPNRYAGRVLIDGGFPNPVPITAAQKLGANRIIAVNVLPHLDYAQESLSGKSATGKPYGIKKIFDLTLAVITSRLIDHEALRLKDGIMIDVDTEGIGISQFEKAGVAIERGCRDAGRYIKQLTTFATEKPQ